MHTEAPPQDEQLLPSVAHLARPLCGCPPTTLEQVPMERAMSHAWHCPVHAVLQQYPSTQKPEAQDEAKVHAAPTGGENTYASPLPFFVGAPTTTTFPLIATAWPNSSPLLPELSLATNC